LLYTSLTDWFL